MGSKTTKEKGRNSLVKVFVSVGLRERSGEGTRCRRRIPKTGVRDDFEGSNPCGVVSKWFRDSRM